MVIWEKTESGIGDSQVCCLILHSQNLGSLCAEERVERHYRATTSVFPMSSVKKYRGFITQETSLSLPGRQSGLCSLLSSWLNAWPRFTLAINPKSNVVRCTLAVKLDFEVQPEPLEPRELAVVPSTLTVQERRVGMFLSLNRFYWNFPKKWNTGQQLTCVSIRGKRSNKAL